MKRKEKHTSYYFQLKHTLVTITIHPNMVNLTAPGYCLLQSRGRSVNEITALTVR